MRIQIDPDVVPGSIWQSADGRKFIVTSVEARPGGQYWAHYTEMGTTADYVCLVEAFQHRFRIFINHNYQGSIWKLSSI